MRFTHRLSNDKDAYSVVVLPVGNRTVQVNKNEKTGRVYGYAPSREVLEEAQRSFPEVEEWYIP